MEPFLDIAQLQILRFGFLFDIKKKRDSNTCEDQILGCTLCEGRVRMQQPRAMRFHSCAATAEAEQLEPFPCLHWCPSPAFCLLTSSSLASLHETLVVLVIKMIIIFIKYRPLQQPRTVPSPSATAHSEQQQQLAELEAQFSRMRERERKRLFIRSNRGHDSNRRWWQN